MTFSEVVFYLRYNIMEPTLWLTRLLLTELFPWVHLAANRFRDVVGAYKATLQEKAALEETVSALTKEESTDPDGTINSKTGTDTEEGSAGIEHIIMESCSHFHTIMCGSFQHWTVQYCFVLVRIVWTTI